MQGRPSLRRSGRLRSSTKRRSVRTSAAMEIVPAGEKLSEMGCAFPSRARVLGGTRSLSWARVTVPSARVALHNCGALCHSISD